jgi:hypothetical protein
MVQLGSHWTNSDKIWYLRLFRKFVIKFKFHWNPTKITGTLHETFSHLWQYLTEFFLEWEIFQIKVVEKIKTHTFIYLFIYLFPFLFFIPSWFLFSISSFLLSFFCAFLHFFISYCFPFFTFVSFDFPYLSFFYLSIPVRINALMLWLSVLRYCTHKITCNNVPRSKPTDLLHYD